MEICYKPIGIIHSPHTDPEKAPIQPCYALDAAGSVEVFPQYAQGLLDLDGYSHIYLLYHFHKALRGPMTAKPFLQNRERGLFSTRLPGRPNTIGLSIVELKSITDNILHINGVDVLNGTPLLDIKPYSKRIDGIIPTRNGWQDEVEDNVAFLIGSRGAQACKKS